MRKLVRIDNSKLKYNNYESQHIFSYVATDVIDQFENQQFVDRSSLILKITILHMFIENYRESNVFHVENFESEMRILAPYMKNMNKLVTDVNLNKITQQDKDSFKEIRFFMKDYIESYECSKAYFKEHLLTMPHRIKEIQKVYDTMIKESLY